METSTSAEMNEVLVSNETLPAEETPVDIDRIATYIKAQDDVQKQKLELVNSHDDAPNVARMVDEADEMQYRSRANKIGRNGNALVGARSASQALETQGVAIQATRVKEPYEVELHPVGTYLTECFLVLYQLSETKRS
jgi:hypothetical protein